MESIQPRITAKEVLVLDSSTFIEEAGMTSREASALKHYLAHRKTQLVVPEVVAEECERNLTNIATGKAKKINGMLEWLGRFCGRVNGWDAPTDEVLNEHAKALANGHHLGGVVLKERQAARGRAERRNEDQCPPSHLKAGLGDCRIWEECLNLLTEHDVIFISRDEDFRGHGKTPDLHPQLQAEAEAVGNRHRLIFYPDIESLLTEFKSEIPSISQEAVFTFVYDALAADIQELETNSGGKPTATGEVTQALFTTDKANVVEVRLKVDDRWDSPDGAKVGDFHLHGSCYYDLTDNRLRDLKVSNIKVVMTEPDGSTRAATGSYVNVSASFYAGARPIQPDAERLG